MRGNGHDVVVKAHIHHAVGLVQHQGFQGGQVQITALQMILNSARSSHHHVSAIAQGFCLWARGHATTQRQHAHVRNLAGQTTQLGGDLVSQLARGTDHQGLRCQFAGVEGLQQTQAKRGSFAAASLGLGNQVAALQNQGQALFLNGRHFFKTQAIQGFKQGGQKGKGTERGMGHDG